MAKRTPPKANVGQSPFSVLKGLSVVDAAPPLNKVPVRPQPPVADAEEAPVDFGVTMAQLGVKRLPNVPAPQPPAAQPQNDAAPVVVPLPPASDAELFAEALAGMAPLFRDELPETAPVATPRLTKLVRKGTLAVDATLDLHGLTRDQVRERVRWFLDDGVYHGFRLVLIVTGRGKSSGADPVLRGEVERYLRHDASAWVAEWDRAPGRLGGEGALVVLLKGPKR